MMEESGSVRELGRSKQGSDPVADPLNPSWVRRGWW